MAARTRRLRAVRAGDRRVFTAHTWRLLHHDHARLRTDDLLRRRQPRPLRRRRRPYDLSPQPIRPAQSLQQDRLLLRLPRAPARDDCSRLPRRECALRHGDPRRIFERAPHAGARFPGLPLPARLLRHRRHAVRLGRRAARQSHGFRQPRDDALDALGRSHRHGGARRHGLAIRAADRCGDAARTRRSALRHHRILADHFGTAAAARRDLCARRHRRHAADAVPRERQPRSTITATGPPPSGP